jgi:hypothetical protein
LGNIYKFIKGLFIVALFTLCQTIQAQKYWVGGNGNWSDKSHWSNTSGGEKGASIPTVFDNVYFDVKSGFSAENQVEIVKYAEANNLDFSQLKNKLELIGSLESTLTVQGRIETSIHLENNFSGEVYLTGSSANYIPVQFQKGDFYGKNDFTDVYKNERNTLQILAVSSISSTVADATCGCNGSITASLDDGVGPFSYRWSHTGDTDPIGIDSLVLTDVCAGKYILLVRDSSDGFPYLENAFPAIDVDGPSPLTASIAFIDSVNCNGGSDGTITATVFGGSPPYKYTWDDPSEQSIAFAFGLKAGGYTLTVEDHFGCITTTPVAIVEEPSPVSATLTSKTNVLCFSNCTGNATFNAFGGTSGFAGYSYNWYNAPGTPTTPQANNLCAGTYNLKVSDGNGCLDTSTVIIEQATLLEGSISSYTN